MKNLPGQFNLRSLFVVFVIFLIINLVVSFRVVNSIQADIFVNKYNADTTSIRTLKNEKYLKLMEDKVKILDNKINSLQIKLRKTDSAVLSNENQFLEFKINK